MKFEIARASEADVLPGDKGAQPPVPKAKEGERSSGGRKRKCWEIEINTLEELIELAGDDGVLIDSKVIIIYDAPLNLQ